MTLSSLPPRLRDAAVLALLTLVALALLAVLPACARTHPVNSPAPSTGVNRVGTPLPGDPLTGDPAAGSPDFAGEFAGPVHDNATAGRRPHSRADPVIDPASSFSRSSVGRRSPSGQTFKNRVGEPIPGIHDSPPLNALTGLGPGAAALATRGVEIGLSAKGTPIHAIEFGGSTGASGPAGMGPPSETRVYLIGLIHGDEDEGYGAINDVLGTLGALAGRGLRVRVVPTMNPDGQTVGRRTNANGVDLNRNWPASNFSPARARGESPADQPEVAALLRDVRTFAPDLLIVFHSIGSEGPFVNFDGPPSTRELARAFADAATLAAGGNWNVKSSMGYETPGSLGTWAGMDRKIPTLTVEFRTHQRPAEVSRAATAGLRAVVRELVR